MLLGKKYTRIKRAFNASKIEVGFTKADGTKIKLPRKLNMLEVMFIHGKVNRKAYCREIDKLIKIQKQ